MTIPLLSPLNTSNPNKTLGCGYLDTKDQIFKSDGIKTSALNTNLVTCIASHLTALGVEEYTNDLLSLQSQDDVVKAVPLDEETIIGQEVNRWNSWAIYICMAMAIVYGVLMLWTYRRDKRDALDVAELRLDGKKLYLKIFLDPIEMVRKEQKVTDI